jgi:hypothetical protein
VELGLRRRNEVFSVLRGRRVDLADCALDASTQVIRIRHKPTGSKFSFADHRGFWVFDIEVEDGPHDVGLKAQTWDELLGQLAGWADEVKYVNETPDAWAELREVSWVLAATQAPDASNAPFTPMEQAEIARRIDMIAQLPEIQHGLTAAQSLAIREKADEFKEASGRLGRKDWVMIVIGGLVSTIMTDEIRPHVIQAILSALLHGIGHLFGVGSPPPIIST